MRFQRLEDLRIDADKTQEEIANVLDCKREVYRRYEKGVYEIPVWALIKLSEYYQVSTDYILGLTDEKSKIENSLVLFFFLPERHFILPEGACGEGISKGNIVPLGPPVGVRDPLRRGPGFLLLFSIKSKGERLCFAEKVPNRRTANVG